MLLQFLASPSQQALRNQVPRKQRYRRLKLLRSEAVAPQPSEESPNGYIPSGPQPIEHETRLPQPLSFESRHFPKRMSRRRPTVTMQFQTFPLIRPDDSGDGAGSGRGRPLYTRRIEHVQVFQARAGVEENDRIFWREEAAG